MVNSSVLTITVAPAGRSAALARSAAGFIATSTSGASPGVMMSWSAKCSWKDETPGSVPAGARISAGKLGSVDRSFPKAAVSEVNRSPVSCIPSPESPAKRMTTRSRRLTSFRMMWVASCGAVRGGRATPHPTVGDGQLAPVGYDTQLP